MHYCNLTSVLFELYATKGHDLTRGAGTIFDPLVSLADIAV